MSNGDCKDKGKCFPVSKMTRLLELSLFCSCVRGVVFFSEEVSGHARESKDVYSFFSFCLFVVFGLGVGVGSRKVISPNFFFVVL